MGSIGLEVNLAQQLFLLFLLLSVHWLYVIPAREKQNIFKLHLGNCITLFVDTGLQNGEVRYLDILLALSGKNENGGWMSNSCGSSCHLLVPSSLMVRFATRVNNSAPFHTSDLLSYVAANSFKHSLRNGLQQITKQNPTEFKHHSSKNFKPHMLIHPAMLWVKTNPEQPDLDLLKNINAPLRCITSPSEKSDPTVLCNVCKGFDKIKSISKYTPPYLHKFLCTSSSMKHMRYTAVSNN
jgi:hypothetical protein